MSINVTAHSFSGRYGPTDHIGDIIHVHVDPTANISKHVIRNGEKKQVILLIDTSASMETSMAMMKSSLLAFRDSILGMSHDRISKFDPSTIDQMFRTILRVTLITFSNTAEIVWDSINSSETYESVVLGLRILAMTNMGDALKEAFRKIDPDRFSWIVVFTDGESNEGPCRTLNSFDRLIVNSKPLNSKIVTIGYGERFNPEILDKIGTFVYVDDREKIPIVLGNLSEEILESIGFNCTVDISDKPLVEEINDDTIIVPMGEDTKIEGKVLVGDRVIGSLVNGKSYDLVYLPHGNNIFKNKLDEYKTVRVSYDCYNSQTEAIERTSTDIEIVHENNEIPKNIRELYYRSESQRLIYRLYKKMQQNHNRSLRSEISRIKEILNGWNDEEAINHREEVLKMIEGIIKSGLDNHSVNTALDKARGSGYTVIGSDGSPYVESAIRSSGLYMVSPLINNQQDLM